MLLLNDDGTIDATVSEMNGRCMRIIQRACEEYWILFPNITPFDNEVMDSVEIRDYFIIRLKALYRITDNDISEIFYKGKILPWEIDSVV